MSDIVEGFVEGIRGAGAPARGSGHREPETGAGNVAASATTEAGRTGQVRASQRAYPRKGDRGPAQRTSPNDYGWHPQNRLELQAHVESFATVGPRSGPTVLDPNIAANWLVNLDGDASLTITALEERVDPAPGAPTRAVVHYLTLFLQRAANVAVTWPVDALWSASVRDPAGDGSEPSLLEPSAAARLDVFVLVQVPGLGWIGHLAGRDFA